MSDISAKRPRVLGARVAGLRLTPEEQFLVARMDGQLSVADLAALTGIEEERVEQVVSKLAVDGALNLDEHPTAAVLAEIDDGGTTSMAEFAAALGMDPTAFADAEPAPLVDIDPAIELTPVVERIREQSTAEPDDMAPTEKNPVVTEEAAEELLADPTVAESIEAAESADSEDSSDTEEDDDVSRAAEERNYRQVYEMRWHDLAVDQRVAGAHAANGADVLALCFDPDPRVIAAILENPTCGLDHVRLIAFHHRTGTGLELVARRHDWLRDLVVERRLLRNPMIGEIVLGRVMGPKRLFPTYKIAIDRDIPELSRIKCRGFIRQKWQTAPSEERADLLLRTEGRCLTSMSGCTFDAKTTAILCGRPINSVMFVQSIAKFGSSPPALLAHLMKQPFVRKNAPIKKMLLAHPNMPGDVKRSL